MGVRTEEGVAVDMTGYTPYWTREEHAPVEALQAALRRTVGPRPNRPIFGQVKFGLSDVHGRGVFADKDYREKEIVELLPGTILDVEGGIQKVRGLSKVLKANSIKGVFFGSGSATPV